MLEFRASGLGFRGIGWLPFLLPLLLLLPRQAGWLTVYGLKIMFIRKQGICGS